MLRQLRVHHACSSIFQSLNPYYPSSPRGSNYESTLMRFPTQTQRLKLTSLKSTTTTLHQFSTTQQWHSKSQHLLRLLNQIKTQTQLTQIHAQITTSGLHHTNRILIGKLIELSSIKFNHKATNNTQNMAYPMLIFSHTRNPNHFSWNTIIRGFAISHYPLGSIPVFNRMRWLRVQPESFTYAFLIKACARSRALKIGGSVHCVVLVSGYASDLYVVSTLVGFYAVCGDMGGAGKVFDEMPERNVVAWNALLCGYVRNGRGRDGLGVFERMWREGFRPDEVTMVGVVSACAQGREIELGRWAHGYIRGNGEGLELSVNVATALIDMYAKCNQMEAAVCVFEKLGAVDVGAWNALIGGYVLNGCFREAIDLFQKLEANGIDPDETTLVSTLRACAYIGALDVGRKIHLLARERCFELNLTLGTALVDMYSKCGCIKDARVIFNKMSKRDVMTWTSMICGLAVHGYAKDALNLFLSMLGSGLKPDGVTFVGVLCACSHAGLVDQGIYYFESMRDEFGINPTIEHYGCVIDLLGRAGRLQETLKLVYSMEIQPNQIIWRTFLGACKLYLNAELAETAVENLIRLHSDNCGDYVLLANIYASKGMWENVEKIRRKLEGKGLHKFPGLSFIKEA